MKVFRELEIRGAAQTLDSLLPAVERGLEAGWTRDHDHESRMREMGGPQYSFSCTASGTRKAAHLFMALRDDGALYVTNIIPAQTGELSVEEYNQILTEFYDKYARPNAARLRLAAELSEEDVSIETWLSADTAQKLRTFSRAANRATGSRHPLDQRRWFAFLVAAHAENSTLPVDMLEQWLIEDERWASDCASELAIEYEYSRDLLRFRDSVP